MTLVKIERRLPYNPKLRDRAKELRKNMTQPEKRLWFDFFKSIKKTHAHSTNKTETSRVLRQRPIGNFIVDFYIPSTKIVIEIDGESHFNEAAEVYDRERTQYLEGLGLSVIRFTNNQVMKEFSGVCEVILKKIKKDIH